jgi:hypothetical protein
LRPALAPKRCRERGEGQSHWVIVVRAQQSLLPLTRSTEGVSWPRS